ncbi:MAG: type II toxin-antitoxin system RelE/ParE family toxin [Proteobacteria bacterium]|nr:hypothetical protein [Pseudomonadota bacterium]NOG61428.1 type II toxin-antitoxin system RelE/ParE family toxin [Pseudomonadota bacterium]
MIIIETMVFTRVIQKLMDDETYRELQEVLVQKPDAGDLIPGSGGLRKIRWRIEGKGKRGGTRIIYYWQTADDQLWMLYGYAKTDTEDLTKDQLKILSEIVERWKNER